MADLSSHQSSTTTKLLLIGDSGAGKTGSLASLADAGYNLRIIDLDNGLDALRNLLSDPKSRYDKLAITRVKYKTITETSVNISTVPNSPRSATVWTRMVNSISHWKDGKEDLGPITSWTTEDVLVIDSLTLAGIAAMNFAAVGQTVRDNRNLYFGAQNLLENLVQNLYSEAVKCNVIITSHISYIENEAQIVRGYPTTIGRALSSKIGRYFNSVLLIKTEGKNRKIYTSPTSFVELKNAAPLRVKDTYEIHSGLADFFKDVRTPTPTLSVVA